MARKKKNSKFIIVILLIVLVGFIIFDVIIFSKLNNLKDEYNKLSLSRNELYDSVITSNNLEELNNKVNDYKNIDNLIEEEKESFYKDIKSLEDSIIAGTSNKKIAYLTFDDGPYYKTLDFLEILDKYDVKATFFTIGLGKERCLDNRSYNCLTILKEEASRGHTVANHTYSHLIFNGLYSSADGFMEQIKKQESLIQEYAGVTPNIARFPGGSRTAGSLKPRIEELFKQNGYGWVDWTAEDGDGSESLTSSEMAMSKLKSTIDEPIEVVLMHDYNQHTYSILEDAIKYLQDSGYILLPLFYESNMVNK